MPRLQPPKHLARVCALAVLLCSSWIGFAPPSAVLALAQTTLPVCPEAPIQPRSAAFSPGGIIITAFDSSAIWVYEIDRNRRYPLPDTEPCGAQCRLSPDGRWLSYRNPLTNSFFKMRLNGTQRTALVDTPAADVRWWSADTLLVWTPEKRAYLRPEASDDREYLPSAAVADIQPGGRHALRPGLRGEQFIYYIVDLGAPHTPLQTLGAATALAWSPDGLWLAYVLTSPMGAQVFGIPADASRSAEAWTEAGQGERVTAINGIVSAPLAWAPNSRALAYWVVGEAAAEEASEARIHILDIPRRVVRQYCGIVLPDSPSGLPRLIWSPDSTHLALGANLPDDDRGALLLALSVESGQFTILSEGLAPVFGGTNPIAWGSSP